MTKKDHIIALRPSMAEYLNCAKDRYINKAYGAGTVLRKYLKFCIRFAVDCENVQRDNIVVYQKWLYKKAKEFSKCPETYCNNHIRCICNYYTWMAENGLMKRDIAMGIKRYHEVRTNKKRTVSVNLLHRIYKIARYILNDLGNDGATEYQNMLNIAITLLIMSTGISNRQLVKLDISQFDERQRLITFHVRRVVVMRFLPDEVSSILTIYLKQYRSRTCQNTSLTRLFLTKRGKPLREDGFGKMDRWLGRLSALSAHSSAKISITDIRAIFRGVMMMDHETRVIEHILLKSSGNVVSSLSNKSMNTLMKDLPWARMSMTKRS